jgi:hypothetical protein
LIEHAQPRTQTHSRTRNPTSHVPFQLLFASMAFGGGRPSYDPLSLVEA